MIKYVAVILLIAHMIYGLFIWLEDHDDNRMRVIRLGIVLVVAVILLFIIYFAGP